MSKDGATRQGTNDANSGKGPANMQTASAAEREAYNASYKHEQARLQEEAQKKR